MAGAAGTKARGQAALHFRSERGAPFHRLWARHTDRAGRHRAKVSFARCMLRHAAGRQLEGATLRHGSGATRRRALSDNGSPFTARETLASPLLSAWCHASPRASACRVFRAGLRDSTWSDAASELSSSAQLPLKPLYQPDFIDLGAPWSINLYGVVFGFSNQRARDR